MRKSHSLHISVTPVGCFWLAVLIITVPIRWMVALFFAAGIHELCHFVALRLAGAEVGQVVIGPFGARMEIGPISPGREALCALAGPLGSIALLPLATWVPEMALCAFFHGAFNLLPVYPMDGGRALRRLLEMWMSLEMTDLVCSIVQWGIIGVLLMMGIRFIDMGGILLLPAAMLACFQLKRGKGT